MYVVLYWRAETDLTVSRWGKWVVDYERTSGNRKVAEEVREEVEADGEK